jgi:hypothetical protein
MRARGPFPGVLLGGQTDTMPTIVTDTDQQPPTNRYPHRIASPPRAGDCCFSEMEWLDAPHRDARGVYQDRRCPRCGFAVRVILHETPDTTLGNSLGEDSANSVVRNVPE